MPKRCSKRRATNTRRSIDHAWVLPRLEVRCLPRRPAPAARGGPCGADQDGRPERAAAVADDALGNVGGPSPLPRRWADTPMSLAYNPLFLVASDPPPYVGSCQLTRDAQAAEPQEGPCRFPAARS